MILGIASKLETVTGKVVLIWEIADYGFLVFLDLFLGREETILRQQQVF